MRYGIKLIIGESFAEIFAGNCKSIGVVTCTAGPDTINQLQHQSETEPATEFKLDIQQERLTFGNQWVAVTISSAQRQSFLTGTWNIAAVLRENAGLVKHTAKQLPYIDGF